MAPYLHMGCMQPLTLSRINNGNTLVEVELSKPNSTRRSITINFELEGNDQTQDVEWRVRHPSNITSRSPWIEIPMKSQHLKAADLFENGKSFGFPLALTSSSVREKAEAYRDTLTIDVMSGQILRTAYLEVCSV